MLKYFSRELAQYVFIITVFVLNISIHSQDDNSYQLSDDVIVSASRYEEDPFQTPQAISILSEKKIELLNPTNSAYSLFGTSGVWIQQTNNGGGSPFVRGLTGNQTLIMIDGIRLNNSTFRYLRGSLALY